MKYWFWRRKKTMNCERHVNFILTEKVSKVKSRVFNVNRRFTPFIQCMHASWCDTMIELGKSSFYSNCSEFHLMSFFLSMNESFCFNLFLLLLFFIRLMHAYICKFGRVKKGLYIFAFFEWTHPTEKYSTIFAPYSVEYLTCMTPSTIFICVNLYLWIIIFIS